MARIGFIGASGMMGHGMARNLLAKGHALALTVHRNRERMADLLAAGATEAGSAAALARESELVFICVTGSPQVEAAVSGPGGLLEGAHSGLIVVDCSTSEPESTARLRERCAAVGVSFVAAPLSRTPVEAEAGRLNVMVGADTSLFDCLLPVLKCFAENVFHVGGPGAGHTIKLLNNFIAQAICTATAEAFAVGQRSGLKLQALVDSANNGQHFDQLIAADNNAGQQIVRDAIAALVKQTAAIEQASAKLGINELKPDTADHQF